MKCQKCKEREANVQIVQQEIGKKPQTFMLCDLCAREMGISIPNISVPVKLNNPFAAMGNAFQTTFGIGADDIQRRHVTRCGRCNLSFDEFRKTGFLGCPECYEAFGPQLDPVFCRTQMGKKHIGRGLAEKTKLSSRKKLEEDEACSLADQIEGVGQSLQLPVDDPEQPEQSQYDGPAKTTGIGEDVMSFDNFGEVGVTGRETPGPEVSSELADMEKTHRAMLISQKSTELDAAVSREDYLTAPRLRDEIAELKTKEA